MTHENRFGNDGTESAGSGEPNDSGDQMNEKDEDLTHSGDGIKPQKRLDLAIFVIRHPQVRPDGKRRRPYW